MEVGIFFGKFGELEDVVYVVFYFVIDELKYVIGIELYIDGGILVGSEVWLE